ncbi:3-dehydroquinate synthase [Candidatus Peregrinibacteria bacterium RIFOXYA12_FULL_33_12]|nr:MAG: 3-dehydroquinate synthase [Candidatus Peregrinibacteria bacterium RIFOXYA2_FULL_33_21]OGJ46781.1 MAG: 3-dehydroquinate synthase [Candidatus Peregrinibacteria bacterium RIFOXYA12_FULL_33_12]OGJ51243.1 MAG: 3-dehydroquinate synthase [Candidatus Peregrinibacteria bacterium RIFOXYB2_FULL_33_20]
MIKVNLVKSIDDSYEIMIGQDWGSKIIAYLKEKSYGQKYAIITDSIVQQQLGMKFKNALRSAGIKCDLFAFRAGETNKTLAQIRKLATKMLHKSYNRSDCVIALGGGIVGDIAGFLAAIFMRGIPVIQIPTSLLAMVDSSIGGKTGVDLDIGKNLIGVFYQPKKVYIDINFLNTLPQKQISNALAEIIKYGCIYDKDFFTYLEKNIDQIFQKDPKVLSFIIQKSCEIKGKIIEMDEKESNIRMILNYGHTIGHAVENLSRYKILHGYAVAIGMVKINEIAVSGGLMGKNDADRIKNLLNLAKLPTAIPGKFTWPQIEKVMMKDKKVKNGKINFIICPEIGKAKTIEI